MSSGKRGSAYELYADKVKTAKNVGSINVRSEIAKTLKFWSKATSDQSVSGQVCINELNLLIVENIMTIKMKS